ncbi:hypothetical protein AAG906_032187 [Vitis piasezkii]
MWGQPSYGIKGLATRVKFAKAVHETQNQLDYIHYDLWGPSRVLSIGGARSPSSALQFKTPQEKWTGKAANYQHLKCIFLGYLKGVKGYKLWIETQGKGKCIISRDVTFNEQDMPKQTPAKDVEGSYQLQFEVDHETLQPENLARDRQKRQVKPPKRYGQVEMTTFALSKARDTRNKAPRYKSRLVAKGFHKEGSYEDLELDQLDVKTTFLHRELDELIYMQPPRLWEGIKDGQVCLLKKSLYGLKQSLRQWYKRFDKYMLDIGFNRSSHDGCVYFKLTENSMVYLLLYVDDMLVACKEKRHLEQVKEMLKAKFEMKDLGSAKRILGTEIERDRSKRVLRLSQKSYISKVLSRFEMNNIKTVSTPLGQHFRLSITQAPETHEEKRFMEMIPYASMVGSVMYTMVCSQPDLAYAVSMIKMVFQYLAGTRSLGLVYGGNSQLGTQLQGFVDVDYAGNIDTRKSLTGYKANLQSVVALSTIEAEYMAVTKAVKEAIWLKGITEELAMYKSKVVVYCDNHSAIHLAKNQSFYERSKHIDVRLHFVRDIIVAGEIGVGKVPTKDNPSDMLTKSLNFKAGFSSTTLLEKFFREAGHLHLVKLPFHRALQTLSEKWSHIRPPPRLAQLLSSPLPPPSKHLGYNHTTVDTLPYSEDWRNLHRLYSIEIISSNRLNMFLGIRSDEAKLLLHRLSQDSKDKFAKVELKSLFSKLTFYTIMRTIAAAIPWRRSGYGGGEVVSGDHRGDF